MIRGCFSGKAASIRIKNPVGIQPPPIRDVGRTAKEHNGAWTLVNCNACMLVIIYIPDTCSPSSLRSLICFSLFIKEKNFRFSVLKSLNESIFWDGGSRNRDFSEICLPTTYLNGYPNIAIFYSTFSLVKYRRWGWLSRVSIRNKKLVGKRKDI
jgi:hypothetical protein